MIYLDHAAATPVRDEVLAAMRPYYQDIFGNPSSIGSLGVEAAVAVATARAQIADVLSVHADEVIFTASGTESTNLALRGLLPASTTHLIVSAAEHHAVLLPALALQAAGMDVTVLPVDQFGRVDPALLKRAIKPTTGLISIILANNEIGTLNDLAELSRVIRQENRRRTQVGNSPILFHTDACQALQYLSLPLNRWGIDAASFNAAKIGGPKGIGLLYLRRKTPFYPLILGGGQEHNRRAGTENVPAIVGFAAAVQAAALGREAEANRVGALRDQLWELLHSDLPDLRLNGHPTQRLPNHLNVTIPGVEAEPLLLYLDRDNLTIGTGAACSSHTLEPSHVLKAIGLSRADALCSIRLTLGRTTTKDDIVAAADKLITRISWFRTQPTL